MSPQKDIKTIRQEQEQHIVDENSSWILEKATTTSNMGNQNVSTATSIAI